MRAGPLVKRPALEPPEPVGFAPGWPAGAEVVGVAEVGLPFWALARVEPGPKEDSVVLSREPVLQPASAAMASREAVRSLWVMGFPGAEASVRVPRGAAS